MVLELVEEKDCRGRKLYKETARTEKQIESYKNLGEMNKKRAMDNRIGDKVIDIKTGKELHIAIVKKEDCSSIKKRWEEKMTTKEKAIKQVWQKKLEKISMKVIPEEQCQEDNS
jgi:hypothetical protein